MNRRYGYIHHDIFVRKLAKIIKGSIRIENAWNTVRYYMRDLGFEEALRDTTKIRKDNYKEFLERS